MRRHDSGVAPVPRFCRTAGQRQAQLSRARRFDSRGFGVENKEDAAYGKIVADTNGYNYRNLAQVANDTQDLIRKIETVDEFRESIAWADIINICIGSNNYLASKDVVWITIGALFGTNDKKLDEIAYGIYDDLNTIYSLIREINPDATLIFDNIYCAWKGLGHIPFIKAVSRINAMLNKFAAKHDDVVIFDTSAVISHNTELLADDCVHPNAKGNVELARHMLILLKNLGLGENTEPVILTPGVDYNFYRQSFGNVFGTVVWQLVRFLTGNVPGLDI